MWNRTTNSAGLFAWLIRPGTIDLLTGGYAAIPVRYSMPAELLPASPHPKVHFGLVRLFSRVDSYLNRCEFTALVNAASC